MFSIGTINILDPALALEFHTPEGLNENGESNWDDRKRKLAATIAKIDLVCLQELREETKAELAELTPTHEFFFYSLTQVGNGFAIRKQSFENFGLTCVPFKGRTGLLAHLYFNGKKFTVLNVHLKGYTVLPQSVLGEQELAQYTAALPEEPAIVAGDFNENWGPRSASLFRNGFQSDEAKRKEEQVDWILARGFSLDPHEISYEKFSDHPVLASDVRPE